MSQKEIALADFGGYIARIVTDSLVVLDSSAQKKKLITVKKTA